MAKIGLYGGSFHPPHIGHIEAARAVQGACGLDNIIFMPVNIAPHKDDGEILGASHYDRLCMLKLATADFPEAVVSNWELRRPGKSYTVDTLRALRRKYRGHELYLLCGSDMFITLKNWKDAPQICKMAKIIAFGRKSHSDALLPAAAEELRTQLGAEVILVDLPPMKISSSSIREQLPLGKSTKLLSPGVLSYIRERHLYLGEKRLERLKELVQNELPPKRFTHTLGVADTAANLALAFGENPEKAIYAAILHDLTKYWNKKEHLQTCEEYGILLDSLQTEEGSLLHSITAAALAEHRYELGRDIALAIRYHTTARARMTNLEKILFLADYIEPTRDFRIPELDALAYRNLDFAMNLAIDLTIEDVEKKGHPLHKDTAAAKEWFAKICSKQKG